MNTRVIPITTSHLRHDHAATRQQAYAAEERAATEMVTKHKADFERAHGEVITEAEKRRADAKAAIDATELQHDNEIATRLAATLDPLALAWVRDPSRPNATAIAKTWAEVSAECETKLGRPLANWHLAASMALAIGGPRFLVVANPDVRRYSSGDLTTGGDLADKATSALAKGIAIEGDLRGLELHITQQMHATWPPIGDDYRDRFAILRLMASVAGQARAILAYDKRAEQFRAAVDASAHVEADSTAEPETLLEAGARWFGQLFGPGDDGNVDRGVIARGGEKKQPRNAAEGS